MEIITKNAQQTQRLGQILAQSILEQGSGQQALVLALQGDLGGGKTTFVQGLAKGLGIKECLTSPSFVIMKSYSICRDRSRPVPTTRVDFQNFYHIDCYRLKNEKDLLALGIAEVLTEPANIIAVEWAERVKRILPQDYVNIQFEFVDEKTRRIKISNYYE